MVKRFQISIISSVFVFLFSIYGYTAECLRCHGKLQQNRFVHTALKEGDCTDCHTSDTGDHPFKLTAEGNSLCLNCHENPAKPGERAHPALTEASCTDCHDPHSSGFSKNLKDKVPGLCYNCHESKATGKVVHPPVKDGECLNCHLPHSSPNEKLLSQPKKQICYQCHDSVEKEKFIHAAVAMGNCTYCHEPHSSDYPRLIKEFGEKPKTPVDSINKIDLRPVCAQCHKDKGETRSVRHLPFAQGNCITCHRPHGSPFERLLQKPITVICRQCHDKLPLAGEETKISEKRISSRKESFIIISKKINNGDDDIYVHGAVKTGRCSVCHEPHQTETQKLLRFSETGKLCFQCHEDDLTGRRSIHPPAGDGTCDVCHSPHGSRTKFNLLKDVPELCYDCHDRVDGGKNTHAAIRVKGCLGCHNPHGSDNSPLLNLPLNELCVNCHKDRSDGSHIITGFSYRLHPVSGLKDPKRQGKEFSCVSCHNPHSSDNIKLFYQGNNREEMCRRCHNI